MIYFFVECGGAKGYGNLLRCLPIHYQFLNKKFNSTIIYNASKTIHFKITKCKKFNWHKNYEKLKIKPGDILIFDTYNITKKTLNYFKKLSKQLFIIDDYGKKIFQEEKIIDWSINSYAYNRLSLKKDKCIIGYQYAPIRKIFSFNRGKLKINNELKKILIIFGGTDVNNATKSVALYLAKKFPNYKFYAISVENKQLKNISKKENNLSNLKIIINPTENKFIDLILSCDLAVVSGGHLLFELACVGMPCIHIRSTYDQIVSIPWKETGFTRYIGSIKQKKLNENISKEIKIMANKEFRKTSSMIGRGLVDGKGSIRLVDKILQNYI